MYVAWVIIEGILASVGALFLTVILLGTIARRRIKRNP